MRFRGGGIGHSSTRAATEILKNDRDELDLSSHQDRTQTDMDGVAAEDDRLEMVEDILEGHEGEGDIEPEAELSDSELVDYGYVREIESDEESEEKDESGEEDGTAVDDLGTLEYADDD